MDIWKTICLVFISWDQEKIDFFITKNYMQNTFTYNSLKLGQGRIDIVELFSEMFPIFFSFFSLCVFWTRELLGSYIKNIKFRE